MATRVKLRDNSSNYSDSNKGMAIHGGIVKFDTRQKIGWHTQNGWICTSSRMGVNVAAKQRAILLSGCGAKTYKMIKHLVAPEKLMETTFAELVEIISCHYCTVVQVQH